MLTKCIIKMGSVLDNLVVIIAIVIGSGLVSTILTNFIAQPEHFTDLPPTRSHIHPVHYQNLPTDGGSTQFVFDPDRPMYQRPVEWTPRFSLRSNHKR